MKLESVNKHEQSNVHKKNELITLAKSKNTTSPAAIKTKAFHNTTLIKADSDIMIKT